IGSFLGSFVGGIAGSLVGDLFGSDPESHGLIYFAANHQLTLDGHAFWDDHGGSAESFKQIAVYTANTVNALGAFAGVQMNAPIYVADQSISDGLQLTYTQHATDF